MRRAGRDAIGDHRIIEFQPIHLGAEPGSVLPGGQTEDRTGIGDDVVDALGWIGGVDRNIGRPGLGDGPHRQHRLDRPADPDGDHITGSDTTPDQFPCQSRGRLVQFAIGELALRAVGRSRTNRHGIGRGFDRGGQQLAEERAARPAATTSTSGTAGIIHSSVFTSRVRQVRTVEHPLARSGNHIRMVSTTGRAGSNLPDPPVLLLLIATRGPRCCASDRLQWPSSQDFTATLAGWPAHPPGTEYWRRAAPADSRSGAPPCAATFPAGGRWCRRWRPGPSG